MYQPDIRPKDRDLPVIGETVDFDFEGSGVRLVLGLAVGVGDAIGVGLLDGFVIGFAVDFTWTKVGVADAVSPNVVKPIVLPWPTPLSVTRTVSIAVTISLSCMRRWASRRMPPERRWCLCESIFFIYKKNYILDSANKTEYACQLDDYDLTEAERVSGDTAVGGGGGEGEKKD